MSTTMAVASASPIADAQTMNAVKGNETTSTKGTEKQESVQSQVRSWSNQQIVQASLRVSISAGSKSQNLMFRSSMDSIYEVLNSKFESKILPDYQLPTVTESNNPYASPEGTANIILGFSLGMYGRFSEQYPGMEESEVATKFIDTIRGGFEKGYKKAVEILNGLGVFNGNVKSDIEKTYDLVMKGYDEFLAAKTPQPEPVTDPEVAEKSTVIS